MLLPFGRYTFHISLRIGRWVGLSGWLHTNITSATCSAIIKCIFRGIPPQKEYFLQKRTQMSLIQVVGVCVTMAVLRLFCHVSKISWMLAGEVIIQGQMRCDKLNYMCTQTLTVSQLNIPYGTKKNKKTKTAPNVCLRPGSCLKSRWRNLRRSSRSSSQMEERPFVTAPPRCLNIPKVIADTLE